MENVSEDLFKPLKTPDFRTKMSIAHLEGENSAYLKCETTIDASVEECAAYNYLFMSRKRIKLNDRPDIIRREAKHFNNHASEFYLVQDFGKGSIPRKFLTNQVWQKMGHGKIVHVAQDILHSELFDEAAEAETSNFDSWRYRTTKVLATPNSNIPSHKYVRAKMAGILFCEQKNADIKISNLTHIIQVDLCGLIVFKPSDLASADFFSDFHVLRAHFSRDREIDEIRRNAIICRIDCDSHFTEEEQNEIQRARDQFKMFTNSEGSKVTINTGDEFVSAVGGKMGGKIWCKLSTTVRCKGVEALAFVMDVTSRSLMSEHDVVDGKCQRV